MPTITIEVPREIVRRSLKIRFDSLSDRDALLLLSLILEKALSPTEEEIKKIAEFLEEQAWKKLRRKSLS